MLCYCCALQAPGKDTGYAPRTLPGIDDALAAGDWAAAREQARATRPGAASLS